MQQKLCFLIVIIILFSFSANSANETKICDATNSDKCVIEGVGTGTGKLKTSNFDEL